jgi:hypothetical protein
VRGELAKIEGVSNIKTDIPKRICTFKFENDSLDIRAKLDEVATTNTHVNGFRIVSGVN